MELSCLSKNSYKPNPPHGHPESGW